MNLFFENALRHMQDDNAKLDKLASDFERALDRLDHHRAGEIYGRAGKLTKTTGLRLRGAPEDPPLEVIGEAVRALRTWRGMVRLRPGEPNAELLTRLDERLDELLQLAAGKDVPLGAPAERRERNARKIVAVAAVVLSIAGAVAWYFLSSL